MHWSKSSTYTSMVRVIMAAVHIKITITIPLFKYLLMHFWWLFVITLFSILLLILNGLLDLSRLERRKIKAILSLSGLLLLILLQLLLLRHIPIRLLLWLLGRKTERVKVVIWLLLPLLNLRSCISEINKIVTLSLGIIIPCSHAWKLHSF